MATLRQVLDDLTTHYGPEQCIVVTSEVFGPDDEYGIEEFAEMCTKLWSDEMDDEIGYISWYPDIPDAQSAVYDKAGDVIIRVPEEV